MHSMQTEIMDWNVWPKHWTRQFYLKDVIYWQPLHIKELDNLITYNKLIYDVFKYNRNIFNVYTVYDDFVQMVIPPIWDVK